jgi:hypothetical protein
MCLTKKRDNEQILKVALQNLLVVKLSQTQMTQIVITKVC